MSRLSSLGDDVVGVDISKLAPISIDASDRGMILDVIGQHRPTHIVNLIGLVESNSVSDLYFVNSILPMRIAEAIQHHKLGTRLVLVGTAAEYGTATHAEVHFNEDGPKNPRNHYGLSKHLQSLSAAALARIDDIDIMLARPFNVIGPGMRNNLVPACFVSKILGQRAQRHGKLILETKNLSAIRDYLSIHDVIDALIQVATGGEKGESYNICSGKGVVVRELLGMVLSKLGSSGIEIKETTASDGIDISIGDNTKLKNLHWSPKHTLDSAIDELVMSLEVSSK